MKNQNIDLLLGELWPVHFHSIHYPHQVLIHRFYLLSLLLLAFYEFLNVLIHFLVIDFDLFDLFLNL